MGGERVMIGTEHRQALDTALGAFPFGLYLMTAGHEGHRGGMLVHSVQRCGADPALICVAAPKGHKIDPLIRDSRSFALGVLGDGDRLIERRFRGSDVAPSEHDPVGDDDPFDAIETKVLVTGSPIIPRCKVWFDCEVTRRVDLEAEMELFVGLVVGLWHEGKLIKIDRAPDTADS
jgi:flavin reductase (DIM6/NTAB) family NADH-FMN oxidoreductase RutF